MKDTSYKNKQFVLLGMTFLSVAGIAGCSKVELAQSTVTLELGDELSENVADYLQNPDEKILKGASLDLSTIDETKVGSYNAAIAYDGKNYPFTVEVKDTTSPQCEAKDYIYMQPGTLTMDDLITEIKDASETSSGIVSCEQKDDLVVCDYDDMLQEKSAVDNAEPHDEADYQESVKLDDEGCYEVTAQVKDSEGNFTDAEWAVASDAFCQDNKISYEFEQKSFNLQKENPVEVLNVYCTVQDQAKNENEADYEVTVTYTGLDVEALLEKTGLIMQISDVTANDKKSGKSDNKSGTTNTQNQLSQASGKSNADNLGMTDDEMVAMLQSMTPDEMDAFLNSVAYGSTTDNNVQVSGYYDNNMAQEVFNLTNQERANNGLSAYSWDSNMASYSDRRAKEIVTDYSHNSVGGNWSVGENIAEGETSASEVVNDWMNSAGHKANILSDVSTKTSVSCYVEKFTYADGSTQYLYHWVQNFTH